LTPPYTLDTQPQARVHFGLEAAGAVAKEAETLGASRVWIAASHTLNTKTDATSRIAQALGPRFAGVFDGIMEHTALSSVWEATRSARDARADLLVSVGGGTIIDGLKIVQIALAEGVESLDALLALANTVRTAPLKVRQIAVPTTLSGAETSSPAGGTDTATGRKHFYLHRDAIPLAIIYDPALGAITPKDLWFSSAIRGVDHCCEGVLSRRAQPVHDAGLLHSLRLFAPSLRATFAYPKDITARSQSQIAAFLACHNSSRVGSGASHGLGYILGPRFGLGHGHTSCLVLPHVLRWNETVNGERQIALADALGRPGMRAGDAVAELVRDLGQPHRLRDVGVKREDLPALSEEAAKHPVVLTNPRPVTGPADVMEILEPAW
jgi:alcohol dehydrogenase class IV